MHRRPAERCLVERSMSLRSSDVLGLVSRANQIVSEKQVCNKVPERRAVSGFGTSITPHRAVTDTFPIRHARDYCPGSTEHDFWLCSITKRDVIATEGACRTQGVYYKKSKGITLPKGTTTLTKSRKLSSSEPSTAPNSESQLTH